MEHQGFESRSEGKKRHRVIHKERGLCINCSKKAIEGETLCEFHKEKNKEYQRKFQHRKQDDKYFRKLNEIKI